MRLRPSLLLSAVLLLPPQSALPFPPPSAPNCTSSLSVELLTGKALDLDHTILVLKEWDEPVPSDGVGAAFGRGPLRAPGGVL